MSAHDRLSLWEYMVTRSTELAEKYFEYAVKTIEGNPYADRQVAHAAQNAAEDYYGMLSETPLPFVAATDAVVHSVHLYPPLYL